MLIEFALLSQEDYSQSARSPFRIHNQVLFLLSWPHTTKSSRTSTPRLRGADLKIPLTGIYITVHQMMTRRRSPGRHYQIPAGVALSPANREAPMRKTSCISLHMNGRERESCSRSNTTREYVPYVNVSFTVVRTQRLLVRQRRV